MLKRIQIVPAVAILATSAILGTAYAEKNANPKSADNVADKQTLGQEQVKQLLLLIDNGKSDKISKQEWIKYMAEEFDRLDKSKTGELDPKALQGRQTRVTRAVDLGR